MSETIFSAIEGNLQGNSRLLIVFNPNVTTGYAARAMKSERFKKFRLNSLNAENVVSKKNVIPGQVDWRWVDDHVNAWCTPIRKEDFNEGDGDFRSKESIDLLKKSDIVVTNPPFSLFRDFISQLDKFKKKFLVISNINAITYKEVFALIKENKVWMGVNMGRGISGFIVPKHYELYGLETKINDLGERIVSPNNCMWLTNLDNAQRHEFIPLTKEYNGNERDYPRFDNYDAINVNKTQDIPVDYKGIMGVPITFLHKFNPNQFKIIKFRKGDDDRDLAINGKPTYFRILIQGC